jgi:hypothetical protein
MAQTKSQSSARRSAGSQRSSASRSRPKAASARGNSRSGRSARSTRNSSGSTRNRGRQSRARRNGRGTAQRVQQTARRKAREAEHSVANATSGAGRTVGNIASKAKGPALATGAAAAGIAGGMFIASRRSRPKLFGAVPLPRPGGTMESVGKGLLKTSENVGQLTEEVRRVREGIEADSKRRSPIEVVLHGLTRRPT